MDVCQRNSFKNGCDLFCSIPTSLFYCLSDKQRQAEQTAELVELWLSQTHMINSISVIQKLNPSCGFQN